jgi:hypothetical protein
MITETTIASNVDAHKQALSANANGPTLLTDAEIAAVGGGILDREVPYVEAVVGAVGLAGGGVGAYAIATGVVLATAPVSLAFGAVMGCMIIGAAGGLLLWEGITHMSS